MTYQLPVDRPSEQAHTYRDKQYGHCWITPVDNRIDVRVSFSNGRKWDGDHFGCNVVLQLVDRAPVLAGKFIAGINAAGFGGTNEKEASRSFVLSPEQQAGLVGVEVEFFQYDGSDDTEFWRIVKDILETVYEAWNDGEGNSDGNIALELRRNNG